MEACGVSRVRLPVELWNVTLSPAAIGLAISREAPLAISKAAPLAIVGEAAAGGSTMSMPPCPSFVTVQVEFE